MKVRMSEEVTLGQLLQRLLKKHAGEVMVHGLDYYDKPTTSPISLDACERVAEAFADVLRENDRRGGG